MDLKDSNSPQKNTPSETKAVPSPLGEELPRISIPDHELLRPIGKGSYGTVWLARNIMGIYRAVKIVYRKSFADKKPFERELSGIRKFEPISRSHEGFVDVLHVGINQEQDCFYYVMELGDEQNTEQEVDPARYSPKTLNKEISLRSKLTFKECLQLGIALSNALGELHKHGLVHRDVKPANIIFVNGVPKLADIGLVADVDEARSYVGTQGFIPPEGPGTPQADIYGLGKVLYEASTGKDRQEFPDLPTELEDLTDREGFLELNEVILQACKNDISKRYQFAWDMHSDLLIIANGKSVKRLKILERQIATAKRVGGIAILALLLAAAIGYPVYRERLVSSAALKQQVGEDVINGNGAVASGDMLGALPFFADATRLDQKNVNEESFDRLRFSSVLAQCPKLMRVWSLGSEVRDAEISPDMKLVLISPKEGGARIYDLETGKLCFPPFGQKKYLDCGDFSQNGQLLLTVNENGLVFIWNSADLKILRRLEHPEGVLTAKFSDDSKFIVTSCFDGIARVWRARSQTNEPPVLQLEHADQVRFATFSHNGRFIVTATKDGAVNLWDSKTGKPIGKPIKHNNWVNYVHFSPDDKKFVTACVDRKARIWDTATGDQILNDLSHNDAIQSAEFSPDGRLIVTAGLDGTARIWRADNGEPFNANLIMRHGSGVMRASFSRDGSLVITACTDGTVCLWSLAGCQVPPATVPRSFSEDGTRFLTVTNDILNVSDTLTGKKLCQLTIDKAQFRNTKLNRNGRFFLTVESDHTIPQLVVRDSETGKAFGSTVPMPDASPNALLTDDGRMLAIISGKTAQIWDVITGKLLSPKLEHPGHIGQAFFSLDGRLLVIGCGSDLYVWNTANGKAAFPPLSHPRQLSSATISPNGKYLATSCLDSQLIKWFAQVWDCTTGKPVGPRLWHEDGVCYVSFSADSKRVVTAGEDHNVFMWEVVSGNRLARTLKLADKVLTAAFSQNGRWIVTLCGDNSVRVWNSETGDPLTPPLRFVEVLKEAKFLPGGRKVLAVTRDGNSSIWELPEIDWPIEDLGKLSSLTSGDLSRPTGIDTTSRTGSPESIWHELRDLHPSAFTTTAAEKEAWHEFEAEENTTEKQWFAAATHLEELVLLHPKDPVLARRLAKANSLLNENLP